MDESPYDKKHYHGHAFFKYQSVKIRPELSDALVLSGDHLCITLSIEGDYLDIVLPIHQGQLVLFSSDEGYPGCTADHVFVYLYSHCSDNEAREEDRVSRRRAQEVIVGASRQSEYIRSAIEEQPGFCSVM